MKETVTTHLGTLFRNYNELVADSSVELLSKKLMLPKSKTLGEHVWCVIGARESYAKALVEGEWVGFSCSLQKDDIENKTKALEHLKSSSEDVRNALLKISEWGTERNELLINLLEHETMHEGQIIRLIYGFEENLPQSWIDRWA